MAMKRAREANVFRGIWIGGEGIEVSNFFYVDDAIFLCDWLLEIRDIHFGFYGVSS